MGSINTRHVPQVNALVCLVSTNKINAWPGLPSRSKSSVKSCWTFPFLDLQCRNTSACSDNLTSSSNTLAWSVNSPVGSESLDLIETRASRSRVPFGIRDRNKLPLKAYL